MTRPKAVAVNYTKPIMNFKLIGAIAVVAAAVAGVAYIAIEVPVSPGFSAGEMQNVHQGMIFRNWEIDLVMDGSKFRTSGDGRFSGGNVSKFSVKDDAVAKQLQEAFQAGKTSVTLTYSKRFWAPTTDSNFIVDSVTIR